MSKRSALAEKMIDAGFLSSKDRLTIAATKAIQNSGKDFLKARAAFIAAIRDDAALLCALFEDKIDAVAGEFLHGIAGGGGHRDSDSHSLAATSPKQQQPVRGLAAIASTTKTVTAAYLARETELGKPLGECNKGDLQRMAAKNRHRAWFYQAIEAQMPPVGEVAAYFDDNALADIDRRWNEDRAS